MTAIPMLQCKIDSDPESLDSLYQNFDWIPNSLTIRPTENVLNKKLETLKEIDEKWMSLKDYILFKVFKLETKVICSRMYVPDQTVLTTAPYFEVNEFPYNIGKGNHWVLWYGSPTQPHSDQIINDDIREAITTKLDGRTNFDFAWYINPKMSVPDFFHVQVFWIEI